MLKSKASSSSATSGKSEASSSLSSYIQMKSPIWGNLEFEATVPEIPLDAALLSYEPSMNALSYESSALEVAERLTAFHEFDHGLQFQALDGICYSEVGVEDQNLILQLEEEFRKMKSPALDQRLAELRENMMESPEMRLLQPLLNKACEGLPERAYNTIFSVEENARTAPQESDPFPVDATRSPAVDQEEAIRERWKDMTLDERIDYRIAMIKANFVKTETLQHPNKPNAKIARHYKVMPNVGLWKNRYVQASIEGLTATLTPDASLNLDVGSILNLAMDGATQRVFEYYTKTDAKPTEEDDNEESQGERFSFVRLYSYQKPTNAGASDNYFLLSLPPRLHNQVRCKVAGNSNFLEKDKMEVDEPQEDDVSESVVHILSLKGQKLVLTRAGKAKRPDIILSYTDDNPSA